MFGRREQFVPDGDKIIKYLPRTLAGGRGSRVSPNRRRPVTARGRPSRNFRTSLSIVACRSQIPNRYVPRIAPEDRVTSNCDAFHVKMVFFFVFQEIPPALETRVAHTQGPAKILQRFRNGGRNLLVVKSSFKIQ